MTIERFLATRAQRAFVATIAVQAVVVLTMVAIAFGLVEANVDTSSRSTYKTIPCYLALFALAEIFELLMALDALKLRNVIQLAGILLFQIGLIVFSALQVHEAHTALVPTAQAYASNSVGIEDLCDGSLWHRVEPFLIVVPCVIAASWLIMMFFVRELYFEFGWAVFHVIGANPVMKTMYQWYQILICLLKFDFFCFTGVTIQLLILVLQQNTAEFGLTIAAIPIVLFLLIGAGLAVKREVKWLMTISLVVMLASETYFYKLVRFYEPQSKEEYVSTRATLTTFTIVTSLLLFATFAVGLRCFSDFDQGLRQAKMHDVVAEKQSYSVPTSPGYDGQSHYTGGTALSPRLSIE